MAASNWISVHRDTFQWKERKIGSYRFILNVLFLIFNTNSYTQQVFPFTQLYSKSCQLNWLLCKIEIHFIFDSGLYISAFYFIYFKFSFDIYYGCKERCPIHRLRYRVKDSFQLVSSETNRKLTHFFKVHFLKSEW